RIEGRLKVTGRATYAAEAPMPNALYAWIVSSTIAKGNVTSIDTSQAMAVPGVVTVITADNMPKISQGRGMVSEKRTPLLDNQIPYAGQYVAVVVADTPERARYGASLVKVHYAPEQPVVDMHDPRAKETQPGQNLGSELTTERGNVEQALAQPGL